MNRFNEQLILLDEFSGYFLVYCPVCNRMARIVTYPDKEILIRLSCKNCGHTKELKSAHPGHRIYARNSNYYVKGIIGIGDSVDWFFHLPLWLKAPCCGHELWAYNYEHLEWLNNYIGAKLRERKKNEEYGWRNKSLASRLPAWMKLAKNKEKILETIKKLKEKIP